MKKTKKTTKKKVSQKFVSNFDPLGSYTGNYISGEYEEPVQDADDL
ncbi:MAG: hypothetical protein IJY84_06020 [Clostridia bacterium]|nr:hypothetical protein [Clostridia bacterium]